MKIGCICKIGDPQWEGETVCGRLVSFDESTLCVAVEEDGVVGDSLVSLLWLPRANLIEVLPDVIDDTVGTLPRQGVPFMDRPIAGITSDSQRNPYDTES